MSEKKRDGERQRDRWRRERHTDGGEREKLIERRHERMTLSKFV